MQHNLGLCVDRGDFFLGGVGCVWVGRGRGLQLNGLASLR